MDYEAIVVGAGPAGSTAAAALAKAGRRVLLTDRSAFPRDKTCGDAIQGGAVEILRELGYSGTFDQALFTHIYDWSIEAPYGGVAAAKMASLEHEPYIARRVDFDLLVYQQAIANGAEFCQAQVSEPLLEDNRVVGVRAKPTGSKATLEFRAPLVIGADGATSVIGRAMQKERISDEHWAIAIRSYIRMKKPLNYRCEFFFPRIILPGYAWIFPIGADKANIGVGVRLDKYRERGIALSDLLEKFLDLLSERVDRGSIEGVKTWQLPMGSYWGSRAFEGCLLVGDAGSFVDPLLGAGIYNGMRTGYLAAQMADTALHEGNFSQARLAEYDRLWKRDLGSSLRRANWVQKIVIEHPEVLNSLVRFASIHPRLSRTLVSGLSGEKL